MKDLERNLEEQSEAMLQAYADAWRIDLGTRRDHLDQVRLLAAAMLRDAARDNMLERLSPEAMSALKEIVANGGTVPTHRLVSRHGAIRRFGPSRLERERPWTDPANAVEELYYAGIVFRGFAVVSGQHTEVLNIPEPLLNLMPKGETVADLQLCIAHDAGRQRSQGSALAEDVLALLSRLKRTPVRTDMIRMQRAGHDPIGPDLGLGDRWLGPAEPVRTAMIWRLVGRLELVEHHDGSVVPSRRARDWLRLSDVQQQASLARAWRDDPGWDELRHQSSLILEETGWRNDPMLARQNLLGFLSLCPVSEWIDVSSWVHSLREHRPGYMRPSGDMDSWFIRDVDTRAYLHGWDAWPRIEGAVARSILMQEMFWLGMVEHAQSSEGEALFRLTAASAALWHNDDVPEHGPLPGKDDPLATIGEDMVIGVGRRNSMYERFQLERFAEWQATEQQAQFKITAESVWASQNAGIKIPQILSFLDRISNEQVPESLRRALLAWGGRFGRVFVRRSLVLQTVDRQTMRQLRGRVELAALLGDELSPTACFVADEHVDELTSRLKQIGIWPHVKL